jgi:hypothetical protein
MRVIEVRVNRADFANTLAEMRQWLDRKSRPLVQFETESEADIISIKVKFDANDLAEQFRQAFHGSYGARSGVAQPAARTSRVHHRSVPRAFTGALGDAKDRRPGELPCSIRPAFFWCELHARNQRL